MKTLCTRHHLWNDGRCPRCALESGEVEVGFANTVGGEVITTTEVANAEYRAAPELPDIERGPNGLERALSLVGVPILVGARGDAVPVVSAGLIATFIAVNTMLLLEGGGASLALAWRSNDVDYWPALYAWAIEKDGWSLAISAYFGMVFSGALERRIPRISLLLGMLALGVLGLLISRALQPPESWLMGAQCVVAGLLGGAIVMQTTTSASLLFGRLHVPFLLWGLPYLGLRGWAFFHGAAPEAEVTCFVAGLVGAWFVEQRLGH